MGNFDEILGDFFLARIFFGPIRIWFEGKGREMAPDILLNPSVSLSVFALFKQNIHNSTQDSAGHSMLPQPGSLFRR